MCDPYNLNLEITVPTNMKPEEISEKITEYIKTELRKNDQYLSEEDYAYMDIINHMQDTENPYIKCLPLPKEAYDYNGEIRESYRQAYKTIIEQNRENMKMKKEETPKGLKEAIEFIEEFEKEQKENKITEEIDDIDDIADDVDDELKPVELAESTTMDIKRIITDIIDHTGIIDSIKIRLNPHQTGTLLKVLSRHETALKDHHLGWTIKEYCENDIELTLEAIKYYGED